ERSGSVSLGGRPGHDAISTLPHLAARLCHHPRMRPYRSPADISFGPGPITPAVKLIIIVNVAMFLATLVAPAFIVGLFGLSAVDVFERGMVWQVATYLFIHSPGGIGHILFNMLAVWMFGVELERRWGTPFFVKYYFICGIGAGVCTLVAALLPIE